MEGTGKNLIESLSHIEKKLLPLIEEYPEFSMLSANSGLKEVETMRGIQWLSNKGLIRIHEDVKEIVVLGENGRRYAKSGLPERKFLETLLSEPVLLSEMQEKSRLLKEEVNVCLGILKQKLCIELDNETHKLTITSHGKESLKKESLEEAFLKKNFPVDMTTLTDQDRYALTALKKRRDIVREDAIKTRNIELEPAAKSILQQGKEVLQEEYAEKLTPEMLKTGSWKGRSFRAYDVRSNVPRINYGKRHFVNQAVEYAKKVWLELGFKEMTGPMIQTSFWNFDALFTAQDHPVRELQDTYYIKDPAKGRLPELEVVNAVRAVHENGGKTGSRGWEYKWNEEQAKLNVLRTHTTVLSAHTIAKLKQEDLPVKYFSVGKCFRNETLDWCHLFEFNQFEGIVVDPNATFIHLLGYLRNFMKKIGFPQARFRPAYFPYTEPSVEIDVYHPVHKTWVELGGAGIFRPEVVVPLLGKDVPVLAWGPGLDRQMMDYYRINDIRQLYKNDLKQLREMKTWMK